MPGTIWVAFQHSSQKLLCEARTFKASVALPGVAVDWLDPASRWTSLSPGAEETLSGLEKELSNIDSRLTTLDLTSVAIRATKLKPIRERLSEIEQLITTYTPETLARESRRLVLRTGTRCSALLERAQQLLCNSSDLEPSVDTDQPRHSNKQIGMDNCGNNSAKVNAMQALDLSKEQIDVATCPHSVFVQGRSGTGKTLALVRRLLFKRSQHKIRTQLFITKSSMLRDEVASQLQYSGCKASDVHWPPIQGDLLCMTWGQLCKLVTPLVDVTMQESSISFEHFLHKYWPQFNAHHLPAQLVWAEFNTRLRPFGNATKMTWTKDKPDKVAEDDDDVEEKLRASSAGFGVASGLSLKEYLQNDLAAGGVRLNTQDQQRIHDMFVRYSKLKAMNRELDDVDVAARVARAFAHAGMNARLAAGGQDVGKRNKRGSSKKAQELDDHTYTGIDDIFIDEAQDFSPAELTVLLSLSQDPQGVAIAGDTCQTINPGSAFNFEDIVGAFRNIWSSRDSASKQERSSKKVSGAKAQKERLMESRKLNESLAMESKLIFLRYNYRCSAGVAALAGSVTRLLLKRFPRCADRIDEEITARRSIGTPICVELPEREPSACILGSGAQRIAAMDPTRIAILVRSSDVRDSLRNSGVVGTVLTVAESKGLEFELVILVGFLSTTSPDSKIWAIADEGSEMSRVAALVDTAQDFLYGKSSIARLTEKDCATLYRVVQAIPELKLLYVAISRARAGFALVECGRRPDAKLAAWSSLLQGWENENLIECWRGVKSYTLGMKQVLKNREHEETEDTEEVAEKEIDDNFDNKDIPALVPALEVRFCAEMEKRGKGSLASALQAHGNRLLQHAEDNPRDRWPVFHEAITTLSQAIVMQDQDMFDQVVTKQLLNGTHGSRSSNILWRCQMICLLRACSLEIPTVLRKLRRLAIWERIFRFLAPEGESDVHNTLCFVAEHLAEHLLVHRDLIESRILGRAWHKFSRAQFDMESRSREAELLSAAHNALEEECEERLAEAQDEDLAIIEARIADALTDAIAHALAAVDQDFVDSVRHHGSKFLTLGKRAEAWIQKPPGKIWSSEKGLSILAELADPTKPQVVKYYTVLMRFKEQYEKANLETVAAAESLKANVGKSLAQFSSQMHRQAAYSRKDMPRIEQADEFGASAEQDASGNLAQLYRWLRRAAECFIEVHPLILQRASKCAEAGCAFLAVGHAEFAARAFEEAAQTCDLIRSVAQSHPPAGEELLSTNSTIGLLVADAGKQAHEFALQAAKCWLLLTLTRKPEFNVTQYWLHAETLLVSSDRHTDAAICSVRAGNFNPKKILDRLVGLDRFGRNEYSLVWLCAALLGGA